MSLRDIGLALVAVVFWGLNFISIKWGVEIMPPLLLTALRYLFAALPAVFFVRPPKVKPSLVIFYGVAVGVLQFGALFLAIKIGMPAGLSSLVIQLQVFFTIGLAVWLLGERPMLNQVLGAAIAFLGLVVIGIERTGGAALAPLLLTLAAALFWGVANIATKQAGRVDMLAFVVWSALVPPIPMFVLSVMLDGWGPNIAALSHPSWFMAGIVAFNSFGATVIGFGLWSVLMGRYPATIVAPFALLVPVVGIGSAILVLGEPLSGPEIAGSALIFVGLVVNVFGARLMRVVAKARAAG